MTSLTYQQKVQLLKEVGLTPAGDCFMLQAFYPLAAGGDINVSRFVMPLMELCFNVGKQQAFQDVVEMCEVTSEDNRDSAVLNNGRRSDISFGRMTAADDIKWQVQTLMNKE